MLWIETSERVVRDLRATSSKTAGKSDDNTMNTKELVSKYSIPHT